MDKNANNSMSSWFLSVQSKSRVFVHFHGWHCYPDSLDFKAFSIWNHCKSLYENSSECLTSNIFALLMNIASNNRFHSRYLVNKMVFFFAHRLIHAVLKSIFNSHFCWLLLLDTLSLIQNVHRKRLLLLQKAKMIRIDIGWHPTGTASTKTDEERRNFNIETCFWKIHFLVIMSLSATDFGCNRCSWCDVENISLDTISVF